MSVCLSLFMFYTYISDTNYKFPTFGIYISLARKFIHNLLDDLWKKPSTRRFASLCLRVKILLLSCHCLCLIAFYLDPLFGHKEQPPLFPCNTLALSLSKCVSVWNIKSSSHRQWRMVSSSLMCMFFLEADSAVLHSCCNEKLPLFQCIADTSRDTPFRHGGQISIFFVTLQYLKVAAEWRFH